MGFNLCLMQVIVFFPQFHTYHQVTTVPICAAMEATVGPEVVGSASDAEVGMSGGDFDFTSASTLGRIASSIFDVEDFGVVVGVAAAFRVERERDGVCAVVMLDGALTGTASS